MDSNHSHGSGNQPGSELRVKRRRTGRGCASGQPWFMIRVLIVDDYALIRRGLQEGLGAVTVGEAQNAEEALAQIMQKQWDIVLMDISMPGRSGLEILSEIKLAQPDLPVLILTMHS